MGVGTAPKTTGHPWFAATYDFINRWSEQRLMPLLREHIAGEATGEALEIGAGTGAGCHLDRATAESVTAAGFTIIELEERNPMPLTPFIIGVARPGPAGAARAGAQLTGGAMVNGASKS